jgi:hypothetical protein
MFATIFSWARANPALMVCIVWPLVTGVLTALFHPRTPAEYDAMPKWKAEIMRFLSATGLDPSKAVDALRKLFEKASPPPALGLSILVALAVTSYGCGSWLHAAERIADDVFTCLVANQDLPDEIALVKCGVLEADKLLATQKLHEIRKATAERDRMKAERAIDSGAGDGGVK